MYICVICFVAISLVVLSESRSIGVLQPAKIRQYENEPGEGYGFFYEDVDGTQRGEIGSFIDLDYDSSVSSMQGFDSYIGPDGRLYKVNYIADENGFQPQIFVFDDEEADGGNSVPAIRSAIKKLWLVDENVKDCL